MKTTIENKLLKFAKLTGLTDRSAIDHGTLYVSLLQPERSDFFHQAMRTFYVDNINPTGGVNIYALRDGEFALDFVPADSEVPVSTDIPDDVDTMLTLEYEQQLGK